MHTELLHDLEDVHLLIKLATSVSEEEISSLLLQLTTAVERLEPPIAVEAAPSVREGLARLYLTLYLILRRPVFAFVRRFVVFLVR